MRNSMVKGLDMFVVQSNLNGSNSLGTIKISSRYALFEPLRVYLSARSESKWR